MEICVVQRELVVILLCFPLNREMVVGVAQAQLTKSEDAEYLAYCAKERCPFGAIYYVTPLQEEQLTGLVEKMESDGDLQAGVSVLEGLLIMANGANAEWYRENS